MPSTVKSYCRQMSLGNGLEMYKKLLGFRYLLYASVPYIGKL